MSRKLEWAHHPVRDKKIVKFVVFRPWSLGMRSAYAPHLPPTPAAVRRNSQVPSQTFLPETRYRDSSELPVRYRLPGGWGGGGDESLA
jgi:hypothetical protein